MLTCIASAAGAPLIEAVITTATCCFLQIPLLWILTGTTYKYWHTSITFRSSPSRYIQMKELFSSVANNGHSLLALCIACIRLHKHPDLEGQCHTTLNVVAAAAMMMIMTTTMKQLAAPYKVAERLLRLESDARPMLNDATVLAA